MSVLGDTTAMVGRSAKLLTFLRRYRHLAGPEGEKPGTSPDSLVRDVQALGPAFIKIGQALSVRPDLLPRPYAEALQQLQDQVETLPFDQIRERVETELEVRISQAFGRFDPEPLAAASLAQVHAATLRDGRGVVVKVQRPGIESAIQEDLRLLRGLARGADRLTEQGRRLHFVDWIDEVSETLAEELDYRLEAENLRVFRARLAEHPRIHVPQPIADFSTARVLTMQHMPGSRIDMALPLRRTELPLDAFASDLVAAYLEQIFLHGLVHADPHPGNLLLGRDGLSLLDLGMVVRLGPRMRDALLRLLAAVSRGDGDEAAILLERMAERLEMFRLREWSRRCARLVARFHGAPPSSQGEGRLMIELTRLAADCGLRPPPEIAVLGRTLLSLDAVTRLLDPDRSPRERVLEHLDGIVARRARQQLSLDSLRAQAAEFAELGRELPRQATNVLSMLSQNRLRIRLAGLEESRLLENLQKIANRIAAGIICAALVIGAALALRVDAGPRLFGYPGLALVMFVLAFGLSASLVLSVLLRDRRVSRYRTRGDRGDD